MESSDLQEFCRRHRTSLVDASIRRIRCTRAGLLLECINEQGPFEWAFFGCRKQVWTFVQHPGVRERLLQEADSADDADDAQASASWFAQPVPEALDADDDVPTLLDALRLWLVQPEPRPPEWQQLEGCRIVAVTQPENDRILQVELHTQAHMGEPRRLQLQAELFSRGLNLILHEENDELANWQGRAVATPRASERNEPAPPTSVLHMWQGFADASAIDLLQDARRGARRERRRLQQLVRGLERDLEAAEQAAVWRKQGELLSAHLHRVRKGQVRVELPDWEPDGEPVSIELDPSLSPQENVARFFKRAKRGERGHETVAARLQAAQQELQALPASDDSDTPTTWAEALAEAAAVWRRARDKDAAAADLQELWRPGGPPWQQKPERPSKTRSKPEAPSHPGRRYVIAGRWEVLVGRSNAENDELTHRFAHPQDVWLHAGGVPGSHVVLRMQGVTDNPPRDVLEQAAALAARFSKAKHAGTVPVIWTRKRYVRKPRGSPPGLAVCTHEKTIFVKPGIPEEEA